MSAIATTKLSRRKARSSSRRTSAKESGRTGASSSSSWVKGDVVIEKIQVPDRQELRPARKVRSQPRCGMERRDVKKAVRVARRRG